MLKVINTFCVTMCCHYIVAQTAFHPVKVTLQNGDELNAEINSSSPYVPKFRNPVLDPEQVRQYTLEDNRVFERRTTAAGDTVFMEILADGSLELLRHKRTFYILEDDGEQALPLIKTEDGTMVSGNKRVKIEKNKYIGVLRYVMRDCPGLQPQIDESKLQESSLQNLLKNYASCTAGEYHQYGSDLPKIGIEVNPTLGWIHNSYEMEVAEFSFVTPELEPTSQISYGISLNFNFNGFSKRFSLVAGYMYHSAEVNGYSEHTQNILFYNNNVSIEYAEHQLSAGLKYEIPWRPVTPYVLILGAVNLAGSTESRIERSVYNTSGSEVLLAGEEVLENTIEVENTYGLLYGFGARLNTNNQINPFIEYRRATFTSVFSTELDSKRTQQMVMAGISWSFGR